MFYRMNQSRFFDVKVNALYNQKRIAENIHLSVGQEASAISACMAMDEGDKIIMTHRHHAQAIGSGMEVHKMMADLLGKAGGYNSGKGGSEFSSDGVNLGAFNQPDTAYTTACGVALAQKMKFFIKLNQLKCGTRTISQTFCLCHIRIVKLPFQPTV